MDTEGELIQAQTVRERLLAVLGVVLRFAGVAAGRSRVVGVLEIRAATAARDRCSISYRCAGKRYLASSGRGRFRDGVSRRGDWSRVGLGIGMIRSKTAL